MSEESHHENALIDVPDVMMNPPEPCACHGGVTLDYHPPVCWHCLKAAQPPQACVACGGVAHVLLSDGLGTPARWYCVACMNQPKPWYPPGHALYVVADGLVDSVPPPAGGAAGSSPRIGSPA